MATASISQVKVGNTTYDVNDAIVRDYLSIDNLFLSVTRKKIISSLSAGVGIWQQWDTTTTDPANISLSNYSFLSYKSIYTAKTDIVIFSFSEGYIGVTNIASNPRTDITVTGTQLYIKKF